MTTSKILKAQDFQQVAEVRTDEKKRVALGKVKEPGAVYKVYVNSIGQIILDPQVMVPASELWLHKNKTAFAAVQKGIEESSEGRVVKRASYAKHAKDEID